MKGLKQKLGMADGISCNGQSYGSTESLSLSVSREDLSDIDGLIWDRWKTEVGREQILGCNYIVRAFSHRKSSKSTAVNVKIIANSGIYIRHDLISMN